MKSPCGRVAILFGSILAAIVAAPLRAEPSSADTPLVAEEVRQLMQDRNYADALPAIDRAAAAPDAPRDYLAYLKGRALTYAGQYDAAIAAFDQFAKDYPKSTWSRRGRFGKAVALARKGDFRSAELLYRTEAEYLLSTERKQQIAEIYLEFADAYFQPPKEEQKPDYAKALEFYRKALEVGPIRDKRIEVELRVAECQQRLAHYAEAAALYEQFSKQYPQSPLDVEARFCLGECRQAAGNAKEARRVWQDLLAKYVDSQSPRIADAQFALARTWNIPQPGNDEELSLGTAALAAFLERFPQHKLAGRAHLEIAQSFMGRGRHEDAVTALKKFLADPRYQDRPEIADAYNLLGRSYQGQKKFTEALATWREFLAKYPANRAWNDVQQQIIDTEYLMAAEKLAARQYDEAQKLFAQFLAEYPLDRRDPGILLAMNEKYVHEEKWPEALANWRRLVSKYPATDEASRAQFSIGDVLESKLGRPEEALEEYRKVTWGQAAPQAAQAIARLTAKTMTVATERVFRGDETPRLKLVTRNVESVTVRAYKVDLETYFRKMHLARGVEGLDIALIDPDRTFEFKVPKYAKYQELESGLEVPLPGITNVKDREVLPCGVMAVTVSSKTLEATTLVVQSDLDVIIKSSRDEMFIFAENMRTGKAWPGVKLLLSNGKEVFAEAATGPDGVLQKSYKELKDSGDLRVFAVAEGNVASNVVDLSGVGVARGLADRGYIYTDRPAYRAGQLVNLRGCLRHAAGDAYVVEKDKKYTVEVFDSRNRLVRQEQAALNVFGSFHAHFVLPLTSPQGQYRILVRDDAGQNYQGTFQVHEYQLDPVRLSVDTPRKVYYRGETIEGTIRAEFYYGAPLAGREIRYQLADDRLQTAATDDRGEVHFKLPTRDYSESQVLPLVVQLPERNVQAAVNFVLSAQGFSIAVSTVRPVFVEGETFEATVKTTDADGKPIAQKLKLNVLERTVVKGKVGERLVEELPLETAADGTARQTLKLAHGGRFVLRAEGIDRFHNPIAGQCGVQISDDEDSVRLRILADRHTYKAGEKGAVKLHWREQPALALVTFQGARILDYKLVELQQGVNELSIPMTAQLAPNFELAVAVMTDPRAKPQAKMPVRFHSAASPFTVERDLRVAVAVGRKDKAAGPLRPGEDLEVTVTTTDPQGKPVAAEVSLALVEQSLLDRFPSALATIQDFFRGEIRQPAVRTTSSITFEYRPTTQPINPRLLAEQDRLEVARDEQESRRVGMAWRGAGEPHASTIAAATEAVAEIPATPATLVPSFSVFGGSTLTVNGGLPAGSNHKRLAARGLPQGATAGRLTLSAGVNSVAGLSDEGETSGAVAYPDANGWQFMANAVALKVTGANTYAGGTVISAGDLSGLMAQNGRQVLVVDAEGKMRNVTLFRGDKWDDRLAASQATELSRAGATLFAAFAAQETGYWNPAVTTGDDGQAQVTLTLPERSTAWRMLAKGISSQTLAGETSNDLAVKKDLFGELKLPLAFTDGDEAQVLATIHNDAVEKGPIEVTLKTTIGQRTVQETKTLETAAKGLQELSFKTTLARPQPGTLPKGTVPFSSNENRDSPQVSFELTVKTGTRQDVVRAAVPLLPYGMSAFATASGSAESDTTAWVEPPQNMALQSPSLQVLVGPTAERSLLDVIFGSVPWCQLESQRMASGLDSANSDLLAALGLQKLLAGSREAGGPETQALDARVRASIGLLVSAQNDDGGWSWTGAGGASNRYASCRTFWALALSRAAAYAVPEDCFNKALGYLRSQVAVTDNTDYESKAMLLHALSVAGQGDFALANRLYRVRPLLSSSALAHLALSFTAMDRKAMSSELLGVLAERNLDEPASRRTAITGALPWSHSPAELRALYALALSETTPQSPKLKELVGWLLAHRTGHRWSPDKATGPAALVLCRWFAASRFEGEHYTLAVSVNDVEVKVLDIDRGAESRLVEVPVGVLTKGKQRVNFHITGRGRYTYQCILGGFVPADKLQSTTADWRVERTYEPAPLELDGREIPRGFDVLEGSFQSFRNPLGQGPVGRRGLVELRILRTGPWDLPEERLEYLVVT
ncbi:MAG: tetratricopeptide repeat protein, partial [Thermoguttaceae bacterium]